MNPKKLDLSPILSYIEKCHEGDLLSFSNSLDKAIFMFHFLAQDTFTDFERQNCCHVLMELKEVVMEIYLNNERCN